MIRTAEAEGKDIFAAAAAARQLLGIGEDEGSVEVLVRPRSGFLGIGSRPARVRVTHELEDAPQPKREAKDKKPQPSKPANEVKPQEKKPVAEKKPAPVEKKPIPEKKAPVEKKPATPIEPGTRKAKVEEFLKGLLINMDVQADIVITEGEGGALNVELVGSNMGAVIGRRGETLDAIQHLTNYALNRGGEKHMHISVDAEDYRAKREESLVHLAEKMAAKAIKYNRSMALEPMNSYERHVIHTALQNYEGVTTASTGSEPNRRVVVSVVRSGNDKNDRNNRNARKSTPKTPKEKKEAPAPVAVEETVSAPAPVVEAPAPVVEAPAPVVVEKSAPVMPEGYEPAQKNKPTSREWC